jgi:lipopolysaccharide transport system permease protein
MLNTAEMQEIILSSGHTRKNYWHDLWRFRELFYFLAWRDILLRYKQTVLGVAWAVVRPLLTMLIFTVIFNRIAKLHSDGAIPYALLVMAGMVPWQFVSTSASEASTSLIMNSNLISKIYFPRLIVPASAVITSFVDFVITLGLMGVMMGYYRFLPDWHIVLLAPFIVLAFMASFGVGLWLAALNVEYRDFRFIVPFIVQFGLYISPVGFSSNIIPAHWRILFSLNPVVGVIDGFRWSLLRGQSAIWWPSVLMSILVSTVLCSSGIWYFRRTEKTFADII